MVMLDSCGSGNFVIDDAAVFHLEGDHGLSGGFVGMDIVGAREQKSSIFEVYHLQINRS
jgi:hypothetical protein